MKAKITKTMPTNGYFSFNSSKNNLHLIKATDIKMNAAAPPPPTVPFSIASNY